MVRYSEALIDEIKSNNDIVDIISQYVILKRSGRNFFGLCPFHKEKTSSFSVSPEKQIFHCFGCGVGGDAITFICKIENVNYREAIEILAERAGVALPKLETAGETKIDILRKKVFEINEIVAEYYHENLYKSTAKPAQDYVKTRRLDNNTLKKFKIGYSNPNNELYNLLKNKGFNEEEILASNLVKKGNYGYFDVYKGRLMFPIQDVKNRFIAFGGRTLIPNEKPKYINSPEGIAYSKGKNLYALNIAKSANMNNIIMCEGYMDAVSLHQRGIPNAVASLGTALTEGQARLLRKYTEKVTISYDSDAAGQAATMRGLEILKNVGCDVRILQMEGAKDPDEYVIKYGNGRFNLLVDNAISLVEFKTKVLKNSLDLNNLSDKIKFLKETAKILKTVDSKIEQELYIDKIADLYKISKEALYAEINKIQNNKVSQKVLEKRSKVAIKRDNTDKKLIEREKAIIALLLQEQQQAYEQMKNEIKPEDFKSEINKKILIKLYEEFEKGNSNINSIINEFANDDETMSRLTEVMAEDYTIKNDEKAIKSAINTYKIEKLDNKKAELLEKQQTPGLSKEDEIKIIEEISKIIIEKKMIK